MKHWIFTVLLALVAAAGSYAAFYALNRPSAEVRAAAQSGDALEWLRAEFKLNEDQFARIKAIHDGYGDVCAEHCRMIREAKQTRQSAEEVARLEKVCVDSMTAHFERVAAIMTPEQGRRYLETVLPCVQGYEHQGAPSLKPHHR